MRMGWMRIGLCSCGGDTVGCRRDGFGGNGWVWKEYIGMRAEGIGMDTEGWVCKGYIGMSARGMGAEYIGIKAKGMVVEGIYWDECYSDV